VPQLVSAVPPELRPVALALAQGSGHPLSRALAQAMQDLGVTPAAVQDLREWPGQGVEADVDGQQVRLGHAGWLGAAHGEATLSASWLAMGDQPPLRLDFSDRLRPGAAEAVRRITESGRRVMLLSGDARPVVAELAERLGIAEWQAGVGPTDKAQVVQDLGALGHKVLMVGDGLNDTAALAAAHVSVSPASALDAARVASDIVTLGADLAPVAEALDLARAARRRIRENFALSLGYNVVAVPFAIAGLATPLMAALAMSLSSISVTLNALRLR
jgi:Cu2+-exporting ATPase